MSGVHLVVPEGIDDPARPSGGNTYDRNVCRGLRSLGWSVHEHAIPGGWPTTDARSFAVLSAVVQGIPDNTVVLLDGLVASAAPEVLVAHAQRLRLVVLVHLPLGHRPAAAALDEARTREGAVLSAAAAVVTTSTWSRNRLLELYPLPAERVHVAEPGVDAADLAPARATGARLLCVAAVTYDKGHDVLVEALAITADLPWQCACVGSLDRDPAFVESLRRRVMERGLRERVCFTGPRTGADLGRSYAAADVLVLASRAETYGMVVTEALARGLPVLATAVGGVPEALGCGTDGTRPGLLNSPEDPDAFGSALRAWLGEPQLRVRLRRAARERRTSLSEWATTARVLAGVLSGASR